MRGVRGIIWSMVVHMADYLLSTTLTLADARAATMFPQFLDKHMFLADALVSRCPVGTSECSRSQRDWFSKLTLKADGGQKPRRLGPTTLVPLS